MNDITWIILGILAVLTVVSNKLIIPYIKSKTSAADWAILVSKAKQVTARDGHACQQNPSKHETCYEQARAQIPPEGLGCGCRAPFN